MSRVMIIVAFLIVFMSGCADKPSKIEKISPCAYCDFSK